MSPSIESYKAWIRIHRINFRAWADPNGEYFSSSQDPENAYEHTKTACEHLRISGDHCE